MQLPGTILGVPMNPFWFALFVLAVAAAVTPWFLLRESGARTRLFLTGLGAFLAAGVGVLYQDYRLRGWQQARILHYLDTLYELEADRAIQELLAQPRYQDPKRLNRFEAKTYSQGGEDGILQEVFRRIGTTNRFFVEFGCGDGTENNTVLLLTTGWRGLWLEADPAAVRKIGSHFAREIRDQRLEVSQAFVTAENIESLFSAANVPSVFDLLSIDIDLNDYHVWRSLTSYRPRVVVIEYNAVFPPGVDWVVDYDPRGAWDGTSRAGASLTALERLGRQKGYRLVGCNLGGVNAFFIREDLVGEHFAAPFSAEHHYEPQRIPLQLRQAGHPRRP